jgi:hypothetical protein
MKKVTAKNVEVEVSDPAPLQKPVPFEPGGERRTVLAARQAWAMPARGVHVVLPADVEFAITPDNLDPAIFIFRPARADGQKPLLEGCGQDLAVVGQEYTLMAFGDGTAMLTGVELAPGMTLYFPSPRYDESGAFSPQNSGLWDVERVRLGRKVAYLRRFGSEQPGATETVKAAAAGDIQHVMSAEHAAVLLVGFVSGVFPVVAATPRWVAVRMPEVPEVDGVSFDQFSLVESFMGHCEVQTDQVASVRFNGKTPGIVVLPAVPGVEAEMSKYEVRGFVTDLQVENLSTQPMKLRVAYRLGK